MLCIFQDRFWRYFRANFALVSRLVFGQLPLVLKAAHFFPLAQAGKSEPAERPFFIFGGDVFGLNRLWLKGGGRRQTAPTLRQRLPRLHY
jgi:hypothetical protein